MLEKLLVRLSPLSWWLKMVVPSVVVNQRHCQKAADPVIRLFATGRSSVTYFEYTQVRTDRVHD